MTLAIELAIAAMSLNLLLGFTGHDLHRPLGVLRHRRVHHGASCVVRYGWAQGWTFFARRGDRLRRRRPRVASRRCGSRASTSPSSRWRWPWCSRRSSSGTSWRGSPRGPAGISGVVLRGHPATGRCCLELRWPARAGRVLRLLARHRPARHLYLVCRGIVKSRVGRSLIAIRDNETAAAVMGVNLARDEDARVRHLGGDVRARRVRSRRSSGNLVQPRHRATSRSSGASRS